MIWFSSDLHFNHDKTFIYKERGFQSISDMNKAILSRFAHIISPEDTLYLLGDIYLGNHEEGQKLFERLPPCNLHIIAGNHDTDVRVQFYKNSPKVKELSFGDRIKVGNWSFLLSHYPTIISNTHEDYKKRKLINLCGHTHSKNKFEMMDLGIYNVGVDAHDCYPVSIETILEDIKAYQK